MTNRRLHELLAHFGPLAKSLTKSVVGSLQDQLHSIKERSSPELLGSVRVDVAGAMRFSVIDGRPIEQTIVAKFDRLRAIYVKTTSPKANCRLQLTSSSGPYLVLVEVKQSADVIYYLRLLTAQPSDFITVASVRALIVVTALALSIDAVYAVLDELAHLLRQEEAAGEINEGQDDEGAVSRRAEAARRRQRRVEREARKRTKLRAREAEIRRELLRSRLSTAYKKLRVPAVCALLPVLLAIIVFVYWDALPDWAGRKVYIVERIGSWDFTEKTEPAHFDREYYQLVFNEARTIFHYVAGWLAQVGLKNERLRKYFKTLRTEADSAIKFVTWTFERLEYPSQRRLIYVGDPRDVDKVTQLMLDALDPLLEVWTPDYWADAAFLDKIRAEYGPLAMEIADDIDGSRSFWRLWSILVASEFKPVYRFLDQNGFIWPPGGWALEYIVHKKDEVPYVRIE